MKQWSVKELWPESTVYILGGGPSLKQEDVELLRGHRFIAVNDSFKLGINWIDVVWFSDCRWYDWNFPELMNFKGFIMGCPPCSCDHMRVLKVKRGNYSGLSDDPSRVFWNKNSGSSAINLATLLGAKRVVLLGFDMQVLNGKNNWHQHHKFIPRTNVYKDLFLPCFDKIAADAKELGVEILNATVGSAISAFPMVNLREVL